ncbi:(2Fe-2S)-binding protein [Streptomyces sp. NPDC001262]|uniref:(2Fe-2S)-binding protein n=1 Tax=Streptomyces sp. NPDC001262 TaxID=3364552 RepID=UPI00368DF0B5
MPLTVHVDGAPHPARPGQTVAAVLLSTGRVSWRETRHGGRPRGVFCGIGVCYDCLVTVNGLAGVRACRREVREGDRIETASPAAGGGALGGPPPEAAPRTGAPAVDVPGAVPQPGRESAPAADEPVGGPVVPSPVVEAPAAPPPDEPPRGTAGTGSGA